MQPIIEVEGIRKAYGETVAVDGVSFSVQPGEIFGIIGPNGAGKTTTVERASSVCASRIGAEYRCWGWTPSGSGLFWRNVSAYNCRPQPSPNA